MVLCHLGGPHGALYSSRSRVRYGYGPGESAERGRGVLQGSRATRDGLQDGFFEERRDRGGNRRRSISRARQSRRLGVWLDELTPLLPIPLTTQTEPVPHDLGTMIFDAALNHALHVRIVRFHVSFAVLCFL